MSAGLEAAILRAPRSPEPRLVYADWLQSRGDPRGELIVVQQALLEKERSGDEFLQEREKQLVAELSGPITRKIIPMETRYPEIRFGWRLGFIEVVRLDVIGGAGPNGTLARTFERLFEIPFAPLIHTLAFRARDGRGGMTFDATIAAAASARRPHVTRLELMDVSVGSEALGPLEGLWRALPNLEVIAINAGRSTFGRLHQLKSLREITVCTGDLGSPENLRSLFAPRWESLTALALDLQRTRAVGVRQLGPLLAGLNFPSLAHLAIREAAWMGPELLRSLSRSGILPQLRTLDLSGTLAPPAAVGALTAHREVLRHLDAVVLATPLPDGPATAALRRAVEIRDGRR